MKGKRYSEEQIVHILKEVERGKSIAAVAREYGVSETTIHRWRGKYRGMDQAELKRLKELEAENARLKKIVADQAVDEGRLPRSPGKRTVSPRAKRTAVRSAENGNGISERRACRLVGLARSTARYEREPKPDDAETVLRIRELATKYKRYGYRRITALLRREGSGINVKRVHRLWKAEGLLCHEETPQKASHGPQGRGDEEGGASESRMDVRLR